MARLTSKYTARTNSISMAIIMAVAVMAMAHVVDVAAEEYKIPGAIAAEPDEMMRKAWRLFHDRENPSDEKEPRAISAGLLRMRNEDGPTITDDTFDTSFAYRLLAAKMPGRYGKNPGEPLEGNVTLKHFDDGVSYLYRQLNIPARVAFARGIFSAAQLGEKDYMALQIAGIDLDYDMGATIEANASKLADIFIGVGLKGKETILSVVADKFRGVEANNAVANWNHHAYRLKGVYWNLGFFISTHWLVGNSSTPDDEKIMQEAHDMKNTKGWAYNSFWHKFRYHTADMNLL